METAEISKTDIYEPWIKWGKLVLFIELSIAVGQTLYSLYMALTGSL